MPKVYATLDEAGAASYLAADDLASGLTLFVSSTPVHIILLAFGSALQEIAEDNDLGLEAALGAVANQARAVDKLKKDEA